MTKGRASNRRLILGATQTFGEEVDYIGQRVHVDATHSDRCSERQIQGALTILLSYK